ncbi:hypothetical protein [Streptomyces sp. SCL15-6]|uniref:hypothetical protein n=1 Tax=Streptomyces sp. SCL15-6 TaxID=2967222 RepID=UPI002966302A|nr:hypothetical protein [Streptomyces sp. SCL15-6]
MSFTWRYVVYPDGSFCRVGNVDGSLDDVSDEELARLHPERDEDAQPWSSGSAASRTGPHRPAGCWSRG